MLTGRRWGFVLRSALPPTRETGWSTFSHWLWLPTDSWGQDKSRQHARHGEGLLGAAETNIVVTVGRVVVVAVGSADVVVVVVPRAAAQHRCACSPPCPNRLPGQNGLNGARDLENRAKIGWNAASRLKDALIRLLVRYRAGIVWV